MPAADELQPKQAALFKQMVKHYQAKSYKKGLKVADKLLQSVPNHPETMALKGLFLFNTGIQEEGMQICKAALKINLKSQMVWHSLGLMHKARRQYNQATKCYNQALKFQSQNQQILRDLALLQLQIRDFAGHVKTCLKLLKQKNKNLTNWLSYATALFLKGDYQVCLKTLDVLELYMKDTQLKEIEYSEFIFFKIKTMIAFNKPQKALQLLRAKESKIQDKITLEEFRLQIAQQLSNDKLACESLLFLLQQVPNNLQYLSQLQRVSECGEDCQRRFKFYKQWEEKSSAAGWHKLIYLKDHQTFKSELTNLIKPYFAKSIPSLYNQAKFLYSHNPAGLEQVFLQYHQSAAKGFYPDGEAAHQLVLPWSQMVLAQHFAKRDPSKALQLVQKALQQLPTLIQLYLVKGRILKYQKRFKQAADSVNHGRKLDLADRYLSNKAIKYLLRAGRGNQAQQLFQQFMRESSQTAAYHLQTMWFQYQMGRCFWKYGKRAQSIRHFKMIDKHLSDIIDDQFDFHNYAMRKYSVRSYLELVQFQDVVYKSIYYLKAARDAIPALIELSRNPIVQSKKKKKKKEDGDPKERARIAIDYYGTSYYNSIKADPLAEAFSYAKNVLFIKQKQQKTLLRALCSAIDILIIKQKPLMIVRCLKMIKRLSSGEERVTSAKAVCRGLSEGSQMVRKIVQQQLQEHFGSLSADQYLKSLALVPRNYEEQLILRSIQLHLQGRQQAFLPHLVQQADLQESPEKLRVLRSVMQEMWGWEGCAQLREALRKKGVEEKYNWLQQEQEEKAN